MRAESKYSYTYLYVVVVAVSILLYFVDRSGWLGFVRKPLETVIVKPLAALSSIRNSVWVNVKLVFTANIREKISANMALTSEVADLHAKITVLEEENKRFRDLLEAPYPASWNFVPARALGGERYMLIDKGKRDGVTGGMVVVSPSYLVGKVGQVFERTSSVVYLWDPESKVAAKTSRGTKGVVVGKFGNRVIMDKVLQRDVLNELDKVYTTGENREFPPNLIVGSVESLQVSEEEVYKAGIVALDPGYNKLETVFVVTDF